MRSGVLRRRKSHAYLEVRKSALYLINPFFGPRCLPLAASRFDGLSVGGRRPKDTRVIIPPSRPGRG